MEFIDTKMSQMISHYVLAAYSKNPRENNKKNNSLLINAVTKRVSKSNPLKFSERNKDLLYEYKIKRFLEAIALGMTPATEWSGEEDASGGYIIVKSDGELVAFLIYDRSLLLKYLFNNTKLEHPSFSKLNNQKKKGKRKKTNEQKEPLTPIGRIYEENGDLFISLPLQIRFTL